MARDDQGLIRFGLFLLCSFLWQRLPPKVGYALAAFIGELTYLLWPKGRRNAILNMQRVLDGKGNRQTIKSMVRRSFRNYCKSLADFMRFPAMSGEEIQRQTSFDRWEAFDKALEEGRGVVFPTLHIGNWDLGGASIALRGYPCYSITDSFHPAQLDRLVRRTREEKGHRVIPSEKVSRKAVEVLRQNGILGILIDRPLLKGGVLVSFFGAQARVPAGAATLALKTGARVLPGCLIRLPDNTFQGLIDEHLDFQPSGHKERDIQELTQRIICSLEGMIRMYPDQWYMFRPMWPEARSC